MIRSFEIYKTESIKYKKLYKVPSKVTYDFFIENKYKKKYKRKFFKVKDSFSDIDFLNFVKIKLIVEGISDVHGNSIRVKNGDIVRIDEDKWYSYYNCNWNELEIINQ